MEIVQVKKYKSPKYPSKEEVLQHPELLRKLPNRWRGNIYVGTALSAVLMLILSGCSDNKEEEAAGDTNIKAVTAPIFEHGRGRGSFGCDSVAPPSFLSEEEAFQVIQEQAKTYGINFEKGGPELKSVKLPETKTYFSNEASEGINTSRRGSLIFDGFDKSKNIVFEFISKSDYEVWRGNRSGGSTVDTYDFLGAAKLLQKGISEANDGAAAGVFYNTMELPSMEEIKASQNFSSTGEKVKAMAKEELRKQVKDFLEWLKGQEIV